MIAGLLSFIFTPIGRWAVILSILGIAWISIAAHYERRGARKVTAQIERSIAKNSKTADRARKSVYSLPEGALIDSMTRD
jgi:hypothetical protein